MNDPAIVEIVDKVVDFLKVAFPSWLAYKAGRNGAESTHPPKNHDDNDKKSG